MARNTKLTRTLQKKICDALRRGHYMTTAAPLAGVSARSAQSWLAIGREVVERLEKGQKVDKADTIYLNFLYATNEATSHAADTALRTLETGIAENPRTAQWFLTRRFTGSWGGYDDLEAQYEEIKEMVERDNLLGKGNPF